jgi:hypothetical protein
VMVSTFVIFIAKLRTVVLDCSMLFYFQLTNFT